MTGAVASPRRYQLRKQAVAIAASGHPWIFRDLMSSAADAFRDGDWLRLVDAANHTVGHGIYESQGAIAIRIVRTGPDRPDAAWFRGRLDAALARRQALADRTDAIRLVHGESDGMPAVVIDRFADTLVASSYSTGADSIARYLTRLLVASGRHGRHAILRPGKRRRGTPPETRVLYGEPPPVVRFREDGVTYAVDRAAGQKTGTYLDLRGLRRAIATAPLAGARVLNLFAYSGMLGRAAELAGASSITQVDASDRALAFAAAHHVADPARHTFIVADIFEWLPALVGEPFDLVIVDPPAMTSTTAQLPRALAAYRSLYRAAARHVRPGGAVVAACCTSRIDRETFHRVVRESLGTGFAHERELAVELDHPVGFPQADYLKIAWWRRAR